MNNQEEKILKFLALKDFIFKNDFNYIEDELYEFIFETTLPKNSIFDSFKAEWEDKYKNLTLKELLLQ
ncbi:hypothetical protein RTF36_03780 [Mammaliicoccus sciuri]|uniref:hypothetical protein n=1 Tax=Mammaliicoccus sciuri TaxID=1296 RepID=UPI000E685A8D|nr:hypothetical protein [Mammaliicoccus sciuri]MCD8883787.1 hypothetical protein [Mammaliicoccus sciuri]MDU0266314.1 hypothetical protein [Mammaliicoccus sciuri]MEB6215813.1 hypothetical protein [Mammaliicoccus sciuri]MEB6252383.1 hypothetical protein [Mammaliicoccus sciuri]MEB6330950.1 hypothetical protein [Mammaliicoccus sciuri]